MAKQGWILLAEDNESEARQIAQLLQQAGVAHRIISTRTGAEALSCLRAEGRFANRPQGDPMFVLLKDGLPVYDAVAVLRTIKENIKFLHVPVIIYAKTVTRKAVDAAYVWGVNAYFMKPRNRADLARTFSCIGHFWAMTNIHPTSRAGAV